MSAGCLSNVPCKTMMSEVADSHPNYPLQKKCFTPILPPTTTTNPHFNSLSSSAHPSIKRTFSADMLALHPDGFPSSLKRTQSSEHLSFLTKDDDHHSNSDEKRGAFEDIWSSIQKNSGSGSGSGSGDLPPPYVHPLVKRSASLLSQKSLEICTESLGSETGSETGVEGLCYPISDPSESDKEGEDHVHQQPEQESGMINNAVIDHDERDQEVAVAAAAKSNDFRIKASPPPAVVSMSRSFPPPLPSLAYRDGSNLHMRSYRRDGRLVLEAVSVPSVNRLRAQRHDGRLLLTLTNDKALDESTTEDDEEDNNDGGTEEQALLEEGPKEEDDQQNEVVEEDEEEEEDELAIVMEAKTTGFSTTESSLIMSKFMELTSKKKSGWPRSFNATIVKTLEDEVTLKKSYLPPRPMRLVPAVSPATAVNAYEYYWRRGDAVAVLKPLAGQQNKHVGPQVTKDAGKNTLVLAHKGKSAAGSIGGETETQVVVVKAAADEVEPEKGGTKAEEDLVPLLMRGCKEPKRRSLLFWHSEPYCIATS